MKNNPLVSVVITTKNSDKYIGDCLKSITSQTYKNIEIIVVDNFSTDKTKEIVSYCGRPERSRGIFSIRFFTHGPERSAQRNFGIKKSKGKYFFYVDSDMILNKNIIKECVIKLEQDNNLIALYIPEIVVGNSFLAKILDFERSFYNGTIIDCVRFIRMKYVKKIVGFDEKFFSGEDWDFDRRIRKFGQVSIIKSVLYHNQKNVNLQEYLRKKTYYSKNFAFYINKWGRNDTIIKKQFGVYYRFFGVFIENGKWKKLITHPILAIYMLLLRFLVGLKYLLVKK